jgi:hypothetical protein
VLAAGLEDWVDFGVICALLLLNAFVGFFQEYHAGSIVDELKKTLALKAVVLRDGRLFEIEASDVVPGDILQIEEVRQSKYLPFEYTLTKFIGNNHSCRWPYCYRRCLPSSRSICHYGRIPCG